MSDYDFMFDSEVVDVSTRGIDRGEDDYVPTDEYTPGVDDLARHAFVPHTWEPDFCAEPNPDEDGELCGWPRADHEPPQ